MECVEIINLMLFICTGLLFLFGAALVGICVYAILEYSSLMTLIASSTVGDVSLVVIIFGCILLAAGGLGMFASCRRDRLVLLVFAGLLAFIILAELGLGIAAFVMQGDIKAGAKEGLDKTMHGYLQLDNLKVAWDETQTQFKCCGSNNYTSWGHYIETYSSSRNLYVISPQPADDITVLPASCAANKQLRNSAVDCNVTSPEASKYYKDNKDDLDKITNDPDLAETDERLSDIDDNVPNDKWVSAPDGAKCVIVGEANLPSENSAESDIYAPGCGRMAVTALLSAMTMIGGILIAVGCLQVLNVFCAVYVAKKIQDDNKKEIEEEEKLKKSENNDKNEGYTPKWKK